MEIGATSLNVYSQPTAQSTQTDQAQASRQAEKVQASEEQQKTQAQQSPVRNAEGQLTGQRVNTTA